MSENENERMDRFFDMMQEAMGSRGYTLAHMHRMGGEDFYTVFDSEGRPVMQAVNATDIAIARDTFPGADTPGGKYIISYPEGTKVISLMDQNDDYEVSIAYDPTEPRFPIILCYHDVFTAFRTLQDALFCYRLHFGVIASAADMELLRESIKEDFMAAMREKATQEKEGENDGK